MTWLWQPLLPGAAQLLAAGGGVTEDLTGSAAGQATTSANLALFVDLTGSAAGSATASASAALIVDLTGSAAGQATVSGALDDGTAPEPEALILGGWSWPVEHAHKRKRHREPFDGLREEIEAIYRRVTGQEPAPAELAEAAKDIAAIVEPFVTEKRIDWRKALRAKQFEYELAIAAAAYEAALRQALEDDDDEDWLLLAA